MRPAAVEDTIDSHGMLSTTVNFEDIYLTSLDQHPMEAGILSTKHAKVQSYVFTSYLSICYLIDLSNDFFQALLLIVPAAMLLISFQETRFNFFAHGFTNEEMYLTLCRLVCKFDNVLLNCISDIAFF